MFQMGDLVTPSSGFAGEGKVFKIIKINLNGRKDKTEYKIEAMENVAYVSPEIIWYENELCLIRTIDSLELQLSQNPLRTLASIIGETVENFHFGNIGPLWKERALTRKVVSNSPETIWFNARNIDREEKDMSKILEIYKEKKVKELEQKYDKQLKELEENDPVKVYLKQAEETIKEMLNVEDVTLSINSPYVEFTQETIDAKNKIIQTIRNEKREIDNKIKEIEALLELAPGYEEKIKILRDYEIVDKKKNIIL